MEKHVYFVRHGETDSNSDGILRGPESMLTEKGRQQAEVVAKRMARIGVDALISSTYPRALETAGFVAKETSLRVEENGLFVEWKQPSAIVRRHGNEPEVRKVYEEIHAGNLIPNYRHSDEESFTELRGRGMKALHFLEKYPAGRICVVTHGVFLRTLFGAALFGADFSGRDFQKIIRRLITSNTGITYGRYGDRVGFNGATMGWELITWNDSAHLG